MKCARLKSTLKWMVGWIFWGVNPIRPTTTFQIRWPSSGALTPELRKIEEHPKINGQMYFLRGQPPWTPHYFGNKMAHFWGPNPWSAQDWRVGCIEFQIFSKIVLELWEKLQKLANKEILKYFQPRSISHPRAFASNLPFLGPENATNQWGAHLDVRCLIELEPFPLYSIAFQKMNNRIFWRNSKFWPTRNSHQNFQNPWKNDKFSKYPKKFKFHSIKSELGR